MFLHGEPQKQQHVIPHIAINATITINTVGNPPKLELDVLNPFDPYKLVFDPNNPPAPNPAPPRNGVLEPNL